MSAEPEDDLVPVSVRLGQVVPPEDPEDWTRPLTWVAALGMLAAPITAAAWFALAQPTDGTASVPATYVVSLVLVAGATATGATQIGAGRAGTATLGAGLFAALVTVIVGVVMAQERQVGVASPTLSHAVGAAASGLAGAAVSASVAAAAARLRSHAVRFLAALIPGGAAAAGVLGVIFPAG